MIIPIIGSYQLLTFANWEIYARHPLKGQTDDKLKFYGFYDVVKISKYIKLTNINSIITIVHSGVKGGEWCNQDARMAFLMFFFLFINMIYNNSKHVARQVSLKRIYSSIKF